MEERRDEEGETERSGERVREREFKREKRRIQESSREKSITANSTTWERVKQDDHTSSCTYRVHAHIQQQLRESADLPFQRILAPV
jgi:hypothetical protein